MAYTDPEVAWVGLTEDYPEAHGHGKILGGGMVGTHAGDMIGEIEHGSCTDVPPAKK